METLLTVVGSNSAASAGYGSSAMREAPAEKVQAIGVTSGGPVIQILPGPFPFPDSAPPILKAFGDEREGLESQVKNGPYSNNVARISGTFASSASAKGATLDSVVCAAESTTQAAAQSRLLM